MARQVAAADAVLGKRGGTRAKGQANDRKLARHGNDPNYIKARLTRDGHADLRAKVDAGELSARAAGIKAGFVKPPDPIRVMRRALEKAAPLLPETDQNVMKHDLAVIKKTLYAWEDEDRVTFAYELIRIAEEALRQ